MKLVGAHRALEFRSLDDFADERVGVEQHIVVEENVVNANHAVATQRHEIRRGRQVTVPDVVAHELKVPHALSRIGFENNERVGEQVVSNPVRSVHVVGRGSGWRKDQAAFFVHRQATPAISRAAILPCILRPSLVSKLAGMRDGVKAPAESAVANIVGSDIPRWGGQVFAAHAANNE